MVMKLLKTGAILLVALTVPAWGGHDQASYGGPTYNGPDYEYAEVLDVQAVTEVVRIPEEREVCHDEQVQRRVPEHRSPVPVVFGAILGGVIGNKLSGGHRHRHRYGHGHGHGHNKAAATAAGAMLGGVIASEVQYQKYPPKYYASVERRCYVETAWRNEERVVAWDVEWLYLGKIYHSRMAEHPGDRIPVRVSVEPVVP